MGRRLLANFTLTSPFWLATGSVALVAAATALRVRLHTGVEPSPARLPFRRILILLAPAALTALLIGTLIRLGTSAATLILLILGVLAAWLVARELYQRPVTAMPKEARIACITLRVITI